MSTPDDRPPHDRSPHDRSPAVAGALVLLVIVAGLCAVLGLPGAPLHHNASLMALGTVGLVVAAGTGGYLWWAKSWGLGTMTARFVALFSLGWLEGLVRRDLRDDDEKP